MRARPNDLNQVEGNGYVKVDLDAENVVDNQFVLQDTTRARVCQGLLSSASAMVVGDQFGLYVVVAYRECFRLQVNFTGRYRYLLRRFRQAFVRDGHAGVGPSFFPWVFQGKEWRDRPRLFMLFFSKDYLRHLRHVKDLIGVLG